VDLNGDGNVDILSGSYSRHDEDRAGLFQVLWGTGQGTFEKAAVLEGTDGQPLIITAKAKETTTVICTRPTAVDLNGDGKLDLVSGNFAGTFAFSKGVGGGQFAPKSKLLMAGRKPLSVLAHSDPFFVDWDADGDLDLLSGSSQGGVVLCLNEGTAKKAKFAEPTELVSRAVLRSSEIRLGDAHIQGPQMSTRVWVDDVNGDGKLDLLVGDSATLHYPAAELDEATVRAKLAAWEEKRKELMQSLPRREKGRLAEAKMKKFNEAHTALYKEREQFLRTERTGFVWAFYQE